MLRGESPDPSPSDSESEPQDNHRRRDTPPHVRRRPLTPRGGREPIPPRRRPPSPRRRPPSPPRRDPSPPPRRSRSPPDRRSQCRRCNPSSSPSPSNSSSEPSRHRTPFDNVRPWHHQWPQVGVGAQEMTGDEYSQRLLQYFEDMINLQVTHSIYYPQDFRGTRDPGPEPYNGVADIDEFERWLVQLLKFYQMNKMCGRRLDLRVIHVGRHLEGEEWGSIKAVNEGTTRIIIHRCPSPPVILIVAKLQRCQLQNLSPHRSRDHRNLRPHRLEDGPPYCGVW